MRTFKLHLRQRSALRLEIGQASDEAQTQIDHEDFEAGG
jgi:hypothetical protein